MEGVTGEQRIGRLYGVVTLLVFCWSACFVGAVINPTDLSALKSLSSAWGANVLSWTTGDPCVDNWQGVYCDDSKSQVRKLLLTSASIVGTIPAAIGSFSGLHELDLSFNRDLQGSIPPEIGQLTTLTSLIIQGCALTGSIPTTLGNLKNLTFLAFNNNQLTGEIPSVLGGLQKLNWFDFSSNNLTGRLPVSTTAGGFGLDTLASCEHIHLNNNSFTGGIPSELGAPPGGVVKLTKLVHLLLESNQLTGSIPDSLANITSLEIVSLSNNQLSGPVPTSLNRFTTIGKLHQLLLGHNQFTGTIPDLTAVATGLQVIDLSYNPFNPHPIPAWLQMATNLQTLYLEGSNIVGNFSETIFALPNLQTLWARNNSLNGTLTIPSSIATNLSVLSLENNQIDNFFVRNPNLNMATPEFKLAGNPVCATNFPFRLASACGGEDAGKAPWTFAPAGNSCGNESCSSTTATRNLENAGNCDCVEPFTVQLEVRRPSFSFFTDELMAKLRQYTYEQLKLQPMQVMVSSAFFTPDGRANININFFNDDGKSELDRESKTNITHSFAFQTLTLPEFKPYIASQVITGADLHVSKKILGAAAISGIVVGILAAISVIGVYAVWQRRRAQRMELMTQPFAHWGGAGGEKDVAAPQIAGARWFSFSEVKKVTNNFATENEIGEGGYGKVYAGILASGERVAVKRAQENSMQGAEEFKNEIELLSRVHHKNLVGLVGYCYDQGEQMLVYEFMANGTMREWLSDTKAYPLDWSKRLSIAIGSARGLTYLHEAANPAIIHRDIKSSNILLSDTHIAKVADFGLSKVAPDENNKNVSTTQVKGTLGYLDPEYYMTNQLSEKSDVYSYGVVLLELLTSRQPLSHGKYIVREVQRAYADEGLEGLEPLLDPCMHEASSHDLQVMVDLALRCVEERGEGRPSMNEVVKVLEGLAEHNKVKAKGSALATDETWLQDVYGEDAYYPPHEKNEGVSSSFLYSGAYTPQNPVPK